MRYLILSDREGPGRAKSIQALHKIALDRPPSFEPLDRDERAAETMRRLLSDLHKLNRDERQAFKAKQQALRKLAEIVDFERVLASPRADRRGCGNDNTQLKIVIPWLQLFNRWEGKIYKTNPIFLMLLSKLVA
jgi:hypothetical protein